MPKFDIECVEDMYSLYVFIFGIHPNDFWHRPFKFVQSIADSKSLFEGWKSVKREEMMRDGQ